MRLGSSDGRSWNSSGRLSHAPIWKQLSTFFMKCAIMRKIAPKWGEKAMIKILFICHGNICRSPMAEFVMKDLVKKAGLESQFHIESAATSTEEIGNPVYPSARRKLAEHGIYCAGKTARQLRYEDYSQYDLLIGMDRANIRNMHRICGGDFDGKMHLLMEFTDRPGDVADPWYTGDFENTWQNVLVGCRELLQAVKVGMGTGRVLYGEKEK